MTEGLCHCGSHLARQQVQVCYVGVEAAISVPGLLLVQRVHCTSCMVLCVANLSSVVNLYASMRTLPCRIMSWG